MKLETQMDHVHSDVAGLSGDVKVLVREFGSFRTEVVRELGSLRTEMATRFGAIDTRLESMNTSMERNTRWLIVAGVGALVTLLGMLGNALKWF